MQENTWDRLRDSRLGMCMIHVTLPTYFPPFLYTCPAINVSSPLYLSLYQDVLFLVPTVIDGLPLVLAHCPELACQ